MNLENLPYNLNVSGSLKNKTIDFYRDSIIDYNENGILFEDAFINKYGSLFVSSESLYKTLLKRKDLYFNKGKDIILALSSQKFNNKEIKDIITETISIIYQMPTTINYALLETFYKIIQKSNTHTIKDNLVFFKELLTFLNDQEKISQIDLDLILEQFQKNPQTILKYLIYNFNNLKIKTFKIIEDELFKENREILFLGEFIAPQRVPIVAHNLYDVSNMTYIVSPIYFLIKNNEKAQKFLLSSRNLKDEKEIYENAAHYVNDGILTLVKEKYELPFN